MIPVGVTPSNFCNGLVRWVVAMGQAERWCWLPPSQGMTLICWGGRWNKSATH